ncbi:MAG: N-acetyltransferase family protein [Saprospiraceae bacterium]
MNITVRKGVLSDMTAVYDLVIELAIYEREEDAVHTTIKDYESAFNEGIFEVLVAEHNNIVIGMMLYYMTYSTWKGKMIYLEDFVVQEKFRRYGIGQILFDEFVKAAKDKEAALIKWQVLDWNEPALAFYRKNKAIIEKNWWNCKVFLTN